MKSEKQYQDFDFTVIGQRLRRYREEANISREQAANVIGCPLATLDEIELGTIQIKAHDLLILARIYHKQLFEILQGPLPFTTQEEILAAWDRGDITEGVAAYALHAASIVDARAMLITWQKKRHVYWHFHSTCLEEAEHYQINAALLLTEAQRNDDPLEVIQNRRDILKDADLEVEYFQCSVPFEGYPSLHEEDLWLCKGQEAVILEAGDPIEILFGGSWRRGFLNREPSGHNFYFYNTETNYIGLTAVGKALDRRIRARVKSSTPPEVRGPSPFELKPRAHVRASILAFLEDASGQAMVPLESDPYLIGHVLDGRGVALVWGEDEQRVLTWQLRNQIVQTARQRGIATPILVFAAATTAPIDEDLIRFYQLPDCLTNEFARVGLRRDEEEEAV